jgi:hypothetical protein
MGLLGRNVKTKEKVRVELKNHSHAEEPRESIRWERSLPLAEDNQGQSEKQTRRAHSFKTYETFKT